MKKQKPTPAQFVKWAEELARAGTALHRLDAALGELHLVQRQGAKWFRVEFTAADRTFELHAFEPTGRLVKLLAATEAGCADSKGGVARHRGNVKRLVRRVKKLGKKAEVVA